MKLIQLLDEYSTLLIALLFVGAILSFIRETGRVESGKANTIVKIVEWILIPPGFGAIFIFVQQKSVYYFSMDPARTVSLFVLSAGVFVALIHFGKKRVHRDITWLGELVGVPGLIFCTVILGLYFTSQGKFESLGTTFSKLEATEGQTAPDFAFFLVSNEETRRLSDYKGNLVLVNVWATWCMPCVAELPDLDKLQVRYKDKGLVVINLSDESFEKIESYLRKNPMETTHGRIDTENPMPEFYQFGKTRPASFLIARTGGVLRTIIGAQSLRFFETLVKQHL